MSNEDPGKEAGTGVSAHGRTPNTKLDVLAGAGLGLLTGVLLGLSVSELVGTVVGGLVALLGAFFGLRGDDGTGASGQLARIRIAAFALGALVGVSLGVSARTRDVLGPSPQSRLEAWTNAGYSPELARGLVIYERLGLVPTGWKESARGETSVGRGSTLLFAGEAASHCDDLSAGALPDTTKRLEGYQAVGGRWAAIAAAVQTAPVEVQTAVLAAAWSLVCEE